MPTKNRISMTNRIPTQNRVINWLQRDSEAYTNNGRAYSKSGYRKNLAAVIIDRKVKTNEAS